MTARIFNIQKYSLYDGPGIRTLFFFKGCPLRCLWCSNPEGKSHRHEVMCNEVLCVQCGKCAAICPAGAHVFADGKHGLSGKPCQGCNKCAQNCPGGALKVLGGAMSIDELVAIALEDEAFYKTSGGGVTLGGGEPLAQYQAATALLQACKDKNLHTAMETCGFAPRKALESAAPHVDLFLYDIKHMDSVEHKRLTGVPNEPILANLAWLMENGFAVRARMPLISGCNTSLEEMRARAAFLAQWRDRSNFAGVDLLPYHKYGVQKYIQLNQPYELTGEGAVAEDFLNGALAILGEYGIKARIVRH